MSIEFAALESKANVNVNMIVLTGVSGSGKTTLKDYLLENHPDVFAQPIQYTTRPQRFDTELDEYVFLSKELFFKKLNNGDFCEYVKYWDDFYALGKYFKNDKISISILDPVGRESIKKHCSIENIPYLSVYMGIPEDIMEYRLGMLRRSSVTEIAQRKKDYLYFNDSGSDLILDGTKPTEELAEVVMTHIKNFGFGRITNQNVQWVS